VQILKRGQKGFTLIELLVVVSIMGMLAAVVTLGVSQFMNKGEAEAKLTELHQVQTVVVALMCDAQKGTITAGTGLQDTALLNFTGGTAKKLGDYFVIGDPSTWKSRAAYDIAATGAITQKAK